MIILVEVLDDGRVETDAIEWLLLPEHYFMSPRFDDNEEVIELIEELKKSGVSKVTIREWMDVNKTNGLRIYVHPQEMVEVLKALLHIQPTDFIQVEYNIFDIWFE